MLRREPWLSLAGDNSGVIERVNTLRSDPKAASGSEFALSGDLHAQAQWQINQGGEWVWQSDGILLRSSGTEWASLGWQRCNRSTLRELKNFVIELTVSGRAEAAGLSFGHFKDFLAALDSTKGRRHLQLEVDLTSGCWAFRIDGRLQNRCWWDSAVTSAEDLISGVPTLKARRVEEVLFQSLALHAFEASCRLSVIMTCYRFLQRLRVSMRNWCHQSLPSGAYELLVVNPESPDGTHEHLAAVARIYPHVRVREIAVGSNLVTNKGAMINRALAASRGEWVWVTDADCLFAPNCAGFVLDQIKGRTDHLLYGQRRYLTATQTDALLVGRVDGLQEFADLARPENTRPPENAPWGYTQIVHRSILERVRYREELNHFAHSDGIFVEDCRGHGITPLQLEGLFCLHMDHPFSWYGTNLFL